MTNSHCNYDYLSTFLFCERILIHVQKKLKIYITFFLFLFKLAIDVFNIVNTLLSTHGSQIQLEKRAKVELKLEK